MTNTTGPDAFVLAWLQGAIARARADAAAIPDRDEFRGYFEGKAVAYADALGLVQAAMDAEEPREFIQAPGGPAVPVKPVEPAGLWIGCPVVVRCGPSGRHPSGRGPVMPRPMTERIPRVSAEAFRRWVDTMRESRGWSQNECARRLGSGINQTTAWRRGGAPGYVGLAMAALTHGTPPWDDPGAQAVRETAVIDRLEDGA